MINYDHGEDPLAKSMLVGYVFLQAETDFSPYPH